MEKADWDADGAEWAQNFYAQQKHYLKIRWYCLLSI